jgi:hypothetical protein
VTLDDQAHKFIPEWHDLGAFEVGDASILESDAIGPFIDVLGNLVWTISDHRSTNFCRGPAEELACLFMAQLVPSNAHPIHAQMRELVYSAFTDSNTWPQALRRTQGAS